MENTTIKKVFYALLGIAAVGLILSFVTMFIYKIDFTVKIKRSEEFANLISNQYSLFTFSDLTKDFSAILEKDETIKMNATNFRQCFTELLKINTKNTIISIVLVILSGATLIGGIAVRIFAKKRKLAVFIIIAAFLLALAGIAMNIATSIRTDHAVSNGFARYYFGDITSESTNKVDKMIQTHGVGGPTFASTLMVLISGGLTILSSIVCLVKPFYKAEI